MSKRYNYKDSKELVVKNHAMVGIVPCSGTKLDSCSDKKFPIDMNNYQASKAAQHAAATTAAQTGNYYETSWWHGGGSKCTEIDTKTECNYDFGIATFGDCWPVEYHLRSVGVGCE